MVIDHVGIAVRSHRALASTRWQAAFGYEQATEIVTNTRQRVRVVFLERRRIPAGQARRADRSTLAGPRARRSAEAASITCASDAESR